MRVCVCVLNESFLCAQVPTRWNATLLTKKYGNKWKWLDFISWDSANNCKKLEAHIDENVSELFFETVLNQNL